LLWSNGVQTNLNSLLAPNSGWVLTSAVGINDAGQIVGNGLLNGQEQAFLLDTQTPSAPEPGSFVLLSAGATLLLTIVSTRRIRIHRDRQNPHPAVAETAYLGAGDSYSPEPVPGAGFVGIRRLSMENGVTRMWP
jgi:hypothetical protein